MIFTADEYRRASLLRISEAKVLFDFKADSADNSAGKPGMALYLAGLAVECMLRAYRARAGLPFTESHSLWQLYDECRLEDLYERWLSSRVRNASDWQHRSADLNWYVSAVHASWRNNFRYATDEKLASLLWNCGVIHKAGNRGSKARLLKNHTRTIIERSEIIVVLGEQLWN